MRRAILLLVMAGLAAGTTAVAQGGGGEPLDPPLGSGGVLHLSDSRPCHGSDGVTLRVSPSPGAPLGWLSVRLDGRQIVRLTGVTGGASVTVRVPRRGGRIGVSAETLDGTRLRRSQRYATCVPTPVPPHPPQPRREAPPITGGGET